MSRSFSLPQLTPDSCFPLVGARCAGEFFGGVPSNLVIDNFLAAAAGADALHPRLTRGFLEYSQHRGFITDPARVRHPRDKPHVERGVQYVRECFFKGGEFRDLAHLREEAAAGVGMSPDIGSMAPPDDSLWRSLRKRNVRHWLPGMASPTRSPIGALPKFIPITTWLASTPSTRCRRPLLGGTALDALRGPESVGGQLLRVVGG